MKKILILSLFFCLSNKTLASFPKNNLNIPINSKFANTMTEERFNEIAKRVQDFYTPIVRSQKAVLAFSKNWEDATVNDRRTF